MNIQLVKDVVAVAALVMIATGCWLVRPAAAWITTGVILLAGVVGSYFLAGKEEKRGADDDTR